MAKQVISSSDSGSQAAEKINSNFTELYESQGGGGSGGSAIGGDMVRVFAWNIGHFAMGSAFNTTITNTNYNDKLKQWKKVLNASCANILLMSEYSENFGSHTVDGNTVTEATDDVLISPYFGYISRTSQNYYVCNAIASKSSLSNGSTVAYTQRGQAMNYRVAETTIADKTVKLVATHLDWTQNENYAVYRAAQIQQLINTFKNESYVIIGGDFNVDAATEFEPFKTNGFSMLNHDQLGDICTYPSSGANAINSGIGDYPSPYKTLDNIIFKGFHISNVQLVDEGTMSDHCGIIADLTLIDS